MKIQETTSATVNEMWEKVEPQVETSKTLEEAAQNLATEFHKQFDESVVLARVFLTVPFEKLPPENRAFIRQLADSAGGTQDLKATTPVLSLVGTHGLEPDWNDRRKSKGHVGIPLISSSFVDAIPMISRLLKELEVPVQWIDKHDAGMIVETIGQEAGLFYVDNASETTDAQGRKIIAAQDFVSAYGVRSVFGIGGAYGSGQIVVFVAFCRHTLPKSTAEKFLALANRFKSSSESLVAPEAIFAA